MYARLVRFGNRADTLTHTHTNTQVRISPLLSRLDVYPLLLLFSALLCERRVVLVSRSHAVLSSCTYAALALLEPFQWHNILLPVAPRRMLPFVCAPSPLLAGVLECDLARLLSMEIGKVSRHTAQPSV